MHILGDIFEKPTLKLIVNWALPTNGNYDSLFMTDPRLDKVFNEFAKFDIPAYFIV